MNADDVTIIIPTFNRRNFVMGAVESALNQTVPCRVIVVDHGSTDGTSELFDKPIPRLTYLRRDFDYGPHFAWLEGLLAAETALVKLLFDDDTITPRFIEQCRALMSHDVGFVFTQAEVRDVESGDALEPLYKHEFYGSGTYRIGGPFSRIVERWMLSPSCFVLRREDCIDALYQGRLPYQIHDYKGVGPDHFMKLLCFLRHSKFGYIAETEAVFGAHRGSITMNAHATKQSSLAFRKAYVEAFTYYRFLKWAKVFFKLQMWKETVTDRIRTLPDTTSDGKSN